VEDSPAAPAAPAPPASWEADVVLRDGHTVRLRPIGPADADALVRFHERQSPESVYFRFFSPRPHLSERDVRHFTHVDHRDRVAFVAVLGDEMVGVARYERYRGTDTAEVAFFVDDRHHGRGLATLLLEFLAAAGRDRGIRRFTASTLPTNRKMLAVFSAAGYEVASHLEDGVIEVAFDISPTEGAVAAMERRERQAEAASVRRLLQPSSVAVVGVGSSPSSLGAQVLANVVRYGFTGRILPVRRDGAEVAGLASVRSVDELPDDVDLVVIAAPASEVPSVVERCAQRGVGAVVILSAGFSEDGPEGAELERRVVDSARAHGLRVLGPNCLGLVNTASDVRLHATLAAAPPPPGCVGVLAESGTLAAAIIAHAAASGLGISTFVAAGNPADVTAPDLLSYWADDDATRGVLLYLGAHALSPRFVRAARTASMVKPVAALHTSVGPGGPVRGGPDGSLRARAMFRQTGVISVGTLEQLFDLGRLLSAQPAPAGRGVAVVGDSDGAIALAADACRGAGLHLVDVAGTTSSGCAWGNPVDLTYRATPEDFADALDAVAVHPEVHSVLVVSTPPALHCDPDVGTAVLDAAHRHPDVTFAATLLAADAHVLEDPDRGVSVPLYSFPEHAALAVGRLAAYREWRAAAEVHGTGDGAEWDREAADALLSAALADADAAHGRRDGDGVVLSHAEEERLLAAYGLSVAPRRTVADPDEAVAAADALGWPVALKAELRDRRRRSALGGVAIDLASPEDLRATWVRMEAELGAGMRPAVVQRFLDRGLDVGVRLRRDPSGASTVEVGLGGPATLVDRWELGVLPLTLQDASALVATSAVGRALTDPLDRVPVVELVHRLAELVEAHDEVASVVANPVVVTGTDAWVADVEVVVRPPQHDLAVRRLD
jgi:acyl-CoA synthetase (NDP forming)/RimJ/RimL family protein N-acetyltransferase